MILTANFSRTNVLYLGLWTGAFYSAYLSGTTGHRRTFVKSEWAATAKVICKSAGPQQQLFV